MKYDNPIKTNVRGSYEMIVSCGPCKNDIIIYQKRGVGNLLRIHLKRVIESEMELIDMDSLICPYCDTKLGDKVVIDDDIAFRVRRGYVHTRRKD